MKSLLLDALRDAKSGGEEKVLSDSGSFDTSSEEFSTTANDSDVDPDAISESELALYETSISIELGIDSEDSPTPDLDELDTAEEHLGYAASLGAATSVPDTSPTCIRAETTAPAMARYAPIACLLCAAIAASSWFAIYYFKWGHSESGITTSQRAISTASVDSSSDTGLGGRAENFPFIDLSAPEKEREADK